MDHGQQPPYAPLVQEDDSKQLPASQPPPYAGLTQQQTGYPPPQYPPQSAYPPQPGYPQPGHQQHHPGYPPPQPTYGTGSTTVLVQEPHVQNTILIREKPPVNHLLHCIISLFFWPWIIVWLIVCLTQD